MSNTKIEGKTVTITMTLREAERHGLIKCTHCHYPPNNHFLDQPEKPCAFDKTCPGYKPKVHL